MTLRRARRGGAVVVAGVLLGGCGLVGGGLIPVPTQEPILPFEQQACPAALLQGMLVADPRWGMAVADRFEGRVKKVLWPYGWAARSEGGRRVLLNEARQVVGGEGDLIQFGGGEMPAGEWLACSDIRVVADFD